MNKINLLLGILLGWLISHSVLAQKQKQKQKEANAVPTASLLWEISGKGLAKPSYLFGTIHMLCKDDLQLSENLRAKFAQSEQLALEIDMSDPKMNMELMQGLMMPDKQSLKTLLTEEEYEKVKRFFNDSLQINIAMVERMKPFFANSLTLPKLLSCAVAGYEERLMQLAKEQQKGIKGVETVQDQLAAADGIPLQQQAQMLVEMAADFQKAKNDFAELLQIYRSQDVEALYRLIARQSSELDNFEATLLEKRNLNWIPVMGRMAQEKPTFFAVGAGHLGGEKGVIALLRKEGYQVKPLAN